MSDDEKFAYMQEVGRQFFQDHMSVHELADAYETSTNHIEHQLRNYLEFRLRVR